MPRIPRGSAPAVLAAALVAAAPVPSVRDGGEGPALRIEGRADPAGFSRADAAHQRVDVRDGNGQRRRRQG
ncbi:hypothetical protein AMK26_05465 [Streptomyces sp. CB03234]|uniref:hypothetical protein n=1 Tax=Streptomyces sp. (strain CB03234) TaxID=1703937 RepID=UPI00093D425F|nr:hypothetical protein [Streptomyces sp. CB03234]OKK08448.1 hypothetical protein AMK26_05465 [Streptomyces sp. CB03234]